MWTENFQMYKLGLEKAEEPEAKLPTFLESWRKQNNSRKTSISASLTTPKSLIDCGQLLKRWEYLTILFVSWETCMQVKKQQLELDMKQDIGSKLGRWYDKDVYCHPAYLASMQSTSWEILGWKKHKLLLESSLLGEV